MSLKLELYYWRQMARRAFAPAQWWAYFKNRYFGRRLFAAAPAVHIGGQDDFELHVLAPASGLWMLYWCLRSFVHFSGLSPKILIHDDGSFDDAAAKALEGKFSNLKVIRRPEADRMIEAMSEVSARVKKSRQGKNVMALALTDSFLLSRANTVMVMDFDLLFYAPPAEIADFVRGHSTADAMATHFAKGSPLNVREEYVQRYRLEEKGADKLISGIVIYKKDKLSVEQLSEYFESTLDPENHFVEQAGWASLLAQTDFKWLDDTRYPVKGMPEHAVCKHFTTPRRYELFAYGIDRLQSLMEK